MIIENIQKKLYDIEKKHNISILYACESGSRAWGFESKDSDYDVRFIYKHNKNWYLSIMPKREVIEYPIVDLFDFSGWDLRKTLFLLNKSNPVLFEWLNSPIVYKKNNNFFENIKNLSKEYFSPISTIYHYIHMATGNNRDYLQGETVKTKKYFYVLRPILSCMWIEKHKTPPPLEFTILINELIKDKDEKLYNDIKNLLDRKKNGIELGLEPKIDSIQFFVAEKLEYFEKIAVNFNPAIKPSAEKLDALFVNVLENY